MHVCLYMYAVCTACNNSGTIYSNLNKQTHYKKIILIDSKTIHG